MALSHALTAGIASLVAIDARHAEDGDLEGRIAANKVIADYALKLAAELQAEQDARDIEDGEFEAAMAEAEAKARWHAACDADLAYREWEASA